MKGKSAAIIGIWDMTGDLRLSDAVNLRFPEPLYDIAGVRNV